MSGRLRRSARGSAVRAWLAGSLLVLGGPLFAVPASQDEAVCRDVPELAPTAPPVWDARDPLAGFADVYTQGDLAAQRAHVAALAAPERGREALDARVAELAAVARHGSEAALRAAAIEALALLEGDRAAGALALLVRALPPEEDLAAAEALVGRAAVGEELLVLLADAASGAEPLRAAVWLALMEGFEEAFAACGAAHHEDVLVAARKHPSGEVRAEADRTLVRTLDRLGAQRDDARALLVLDRVVDGWSRTELDLYAANYLIRSGRELERAAVLAARVWEREALADDWPAVRQRFLARYLQAAAELAQGAPREAYVALDAAAAVLEEALSGRPDLQPEPARPSKHGGETAHDLFELRGLVELLAAHAALAEGAAAGDPVVLGHLRAAHENALLAQLRRLATDDQAGYESLDGLFDHELAPRRLVFSAPDNPTWSGPGRDRGLDVLLAVGRAMAVVGGPELPGFEAPTAVAPGFGPARDDLRRANLLKLMQPAELAAIQRRLNQSWDQNELQILELRRRLVTEDLQRALEEDFPNLDDLRIPSMYALTMASDLNREDRAEEAVALAERLFADMDAAGELDDGANGSWLAARIELELGGALGEAGRPRDAVPVLESAVRRLEAIENTLVERRADEREARRLPLYDTQIEQTQRMQSQVLVALAVNANVRLGDPKTALAYFERAYALDESEFMRGLLACYRARFGADDEARQLLRTIRPSPPVYYNLACAWALLGEADRALELLARELAENHPTPGALARQKRWAREDPDLASLAEDPRFLELTAP